MNLLWVIVGLLILVVVAPFITEPLDRYMAERRSRFKEKLLKETRKKFKKHGIEFCEEDWKKYIQKNTF
jgi:6-phosphogluconate dehydrogenase (decarboxylating)